MRIPRLTPATCGTFLTALPLLTFAAVAQASSPALTRLHDFTGNDSDGANPYAGVVGGPGGVLYGTTLWGGTGACSDCGTAFSLTPPASPGGVWTESVHTLPLASGLRPYAGLTLSPGGTVYGAGYDGGACGFGAVFELKPPAFSGGAWEEKPVYTGFCNPLTGGYLKAGVVIGSGGVLYGTSIYGGGGNGTSAEPGAVYELTPPAAAGGTWSFAAIHGFGFAVGDGSAPTTGVTVGSGGVLYGTLGNGGTAGHGMVYSLTPSALPGGAWTETILYSFGSGSNGGSDGANPQAGVVIGTGGVLYGTTESGGPSNDGTVYSLAPPSSPGGAWTETILHSFAGGSHGATPTAGVAIGRGGVLFGTTNSGGSSNEGTVFALSPPATPGGTWADRILHSFTGGSDGGNPQGGLIISGGGVLYGTTYAGGTGLACSGGCGTVFSLVP